MNIRGVAWHVISWVFSFVSSQDCRRGRGYLHLRLTHYSSRLSMCVTKGDRKGKGGDILDMEMEERITVGAKLLRCAESSSYGFGTRFFHGIMNA